MESHLPISFTILSFDLFESGRSKVFFWEDTWIQDHSLPCQLPWLCLLSSFHNAPIFAFAHQTDGIVAGNFHFTQNLSNRETYGMLNLLNLLDHFRPNSQVDTIIWVLETLALYTCKSFFDCQFGIQSSTNFLLHLRI